MDPKISINLINYNNREYIDEFLDGLNTFTDTLNYEYEIVLVDNYSDDGSWETLSSIADKSLQLRYEYGSEDEAGYIGRLRNKCLELADGSFYLSQLDTDNKALPVLGRITNWYIDKSPKYSIVTNWELKHSDGWSISPCLHRSHIADDIGYADTQWNSDTLMWERLIDRNLFKFLRVRTVKHLDHVHNDQRHGSRHISKYDFPTNEPMKHRDMEMILDMADKGILSTEITIRELGPWLHNFNIDGIDTRKVNRKMEHVSDDWPRPRWEQIKQYIPEKADTVVDLGCVEGKMSYHLDSQGLDVVGVDSREDRVWRAEYARHKKGGEYSIVHDNVLSFLENNDKQFDIVLASAILYHSHDPERLLELIQEKTDVRWIIETGTWDDYDSLTKVNYEGPDVKYAFSYDWVKEQLDGVIEKIRDADNGCRDLFVGEPVDKI